MKAVVFQEANRLVIQDCPKPEIGESDALIKIHACGICGTDIHIFYGEHLVKFPVIPGHEFSGTVTAIGSRVTNVQVGDRVTVDPNIVDHTCWFCRRGDIHLCENLTAVGVNFDGGFAEYCSVPAVQAYKVLDSLSLDESAMTEPLACCIHGIDRAGITPGSNVVVLGAGSIGLMLIQLARIAGAGHILASEPDETKRHLAARLGADVVASPQEIVREVAELTKVGADVVIESAGRVETAELAIRLVRRGGTILQFGVTSPGQQARIAPYDIFNKELTIRGSFVNPFTHSRAIELLTSKQIDVMPLITHRFSLDDAAKGLQTAQGGDAIKILLTPE